MDISTLNTEQLLKLNSYLSEFVSDNKKSLAEIVLQNRTKYITIVLEDIFQPHNASAVIRSAEAFGIQEVNIIEQKNKYRINPDVTLGSNKWVTIKKYNEPEISNTNHCLSQLKENGYKIVATTLRPECIDLKDLPVDKKLALCFGNEEFGLTDEAHDLADYKVSIPMTGFTRSFNISVSAAICMYDIVGRLKSQDVNWQLKEEEKLKLKIEWYLMNMKNSHKYLENYEKSL